MRAGSSASRRSRSTATTARSANRCPSARRPRARRAEKPIEARPVRRRLPKKRPSQTVSFTVGGAEGYLTAGSYPDDGLGEIFVKLGKQGSTLSGVMDAFSMSISVGLQYGIPLEFYVSKFSNLRFEPAGMTDDPDLRIATSVVDYLFRRLALDYLPYAKRAQLGIFSARSAPPRSRHLRGRRRGVARSVDVEQAPHTGGGAAPAPVEVAAPPSCWSCALGKAADAPLCMTCGTKMRPAAAATSARAAAPRAAAADTSDGGAPHRAPPSGRVALGRVGGNIGSTGARGAAATVRRSTGQAGSSRGSSPPRRRSAAGRCGTGSARLRPPPPACCRASRARARRACATGTTASLPPQTAGVGIPQVLCSGRAPRWRTRRPNGRRAARRNGRSRAVLGDHEMARRGRTEHLDRGGRAVADAVDEHERRTRARQPERTLGRRARRDLQRDSAAQRSELVPVITARASSFDYRSVAPTVVTLSELAGSSSNAAAQRTRCERSRTS